MLIDVSTMKEAARIPRERARSFSTIESRLGPQRLQAIKDELNAMIDADMAKGTDIQTAGWMPSKAQVHGKDGWEGTVFQPIHDVAASGDYELSGRLFGLIVWVVFSERPERWGFGNYELNGKPIRSKTYFLLRTPATV